MAEYHGMNEMLAIRGTLLHGPGAPVMRTEAAGPRRLLASTGDCAIPQSVGTLAHRAPGPGGPSSRRHWPMEDGGGSASPKLCHRPSRARFDGTLAVTAMGCRCRGAPGPIRRGWQAADLTNGRCPLPGCGAPTPGTDEPHRAPDASDICLVRPPGWQRERMRRSGCLVVSTVPGPGRALHHKPIQPPSGARPDQGCLRMPHGLSEFWTR